MSLKFVEWSITIRYNTGACQEQQADLTGKPSMGGVAGIVPTAQVLPDRTTTTRYSSLHFYLLSWQSWHRGKIKLCRYTFSKLSSAKRGGIFRGHIN